MNNKAIYAAVVVVVLVVVVLAVYAVVANGDEDEPVSDLDEAELKVYGNVNGDRYLDEDDVELLQQLVDDGATVDDYPIADANQDGAIDEDDVAVVQAVVDGETTTIWHVNYHDTDGDGVIDEEIVSTQYPITSVIFTGSANIAVALFALGIIDEVKGASYSDSTLDPVLYSDTYLDTSKVVRLGTTAPDITFEDGQAGSSNVIAEEGVTALITDWNQTYITNEDDFEAAGVDVVRISAGSSDSETMTHTFMLLGLLFQCVDRAEAYLDINLELLDYVIDAVADAEPATFIASSMTGRVSSGDSDYSQVCILAGGEFALEGMDFGGSTSIRISEHPEIYANYEFDYIIHLRTGLSYDQTEEDVMSNYETYCDAFSDWEHADTGQYLVSGSISVPLRIAYVATVFHPGLVDIDTINDYHQQIVDEFFNGVELDISSMYFVVGPDDA